MPAEPVADSTSTGTDTESLAAIDAPCVAPTDRPFALRSVLIQSIAILFGAAGFAWFLRQILGDDLRQTHWMLMVLLAAVSLAAGCWGAVSRWRDYTVPMRNLQALLPRVRIGECPIDELNTIDRGLAPLVPLIQELIRDLRLERTRNAELQEEIRQRVLTRTDALERKIGSLQQQATRDALTGLNNRRQLDQQLPVLMDQCKDRYADLTVLMIDVDYFKTLNDTLGHAAGDQLLRQIAQLIRSSIRASDSAYRCGGDEFVVVLPGASTDIGKRLADRLRSLVDSLGKTLKVPRAPRLSIGLASIFESNPSDAAALLALADKALYDIKAARGGSSRVA